MRTTRDAIVKGKKLVRYHPIVIRFVMMISSRLNKGTYDFISSVFNLPSSRLIANYDSFDGSAKDGVLFEAVRILSKRMKDGMRKAKEDGANDSKLE